MRELAKEARMLHIDPQSLCTEESMRKPEFDAEAILAGLQARIDAARNGLDEALASVKLAEERVEAWQNVYTTFSELIKRTPPDVLAELVMQSGLPGRLFDKPEKAIGQHSLEEKIPSSATPAQVADAAKETLLETGRPMKRGQLVRALTAKGITLAGADKNKNLGTILWRYDGMFVSLPSLGYWVKGIPLEGVYDPKKD